MINSVVGENHTIHNRLMSDNRLGYLDGMRGIAAILVMISHMWLTLWPIYSPHSSSSWLRNEHGWILIGHFSVDLFIVLSGFCLMLPVLRKGHLPGGVWTFCKKRFRRIVPPFWSALIFSSALLLTIIRYKTGTHWDICVPFTKKALLVNALLLQDAHPKIINHAFWSIAVEWHIYFLFPTLVFLWVRFGPEKTTLTALIAGYFLFFCLHHTPYLGITPWYLGLFALGMYAASTAYSGTIPRNPHRLWEISALCLALLIFLICCFQGWAWVMRQYAYVDLLAGLCAASILIAASSPMHPINRALSVRPLVQVGTFAYSLYLIHAPLIQVIWQYLLHPIHLSDTLTFFLLTSVGSVLIVGCSFIFHLIFERPFMSKPSPKTKQEAEIAAAISPAP